MLKAVIDLSHHNTISNIAKNGAIFAPPRLTEIPPAAADVTAAYPDSNSSWKDGGPYNYAGWAAESEMIAKTFVYRGLIENRAPRQDTKRQSSKSLNIGSRGQATGLRHS